MNKEAENRNNYMSEEFQKRINAAFLKGLSYQSQYLMSSEQNIEKGSQPVNPAKKSLKHNSKNNQRK